MIVTMFDSRVKTKCADKKEMQSSSMAQLKAARAERENSGNGKMKGERVSHLVKDKSTENA